MSEVRAVVVDPEVAGRLKIASVEAPIPAPSEALVRITAVSLNRGEVRRAMAANAGWRPGWDAAGTIEQQAEDGSGPPNGARVVGLLGSGAWTELAAISTNRLAQLPDSVSFAQAATLPVAGLTALRALERGGLLLERRVLITGASGGVGDFACQMARTAGAMVVGAVHNPMHAEAAREFGAHEVVAGDDPDGARQWAPYHLILDSVGGRSLGVALSMIAPDGTCVSYGISAGVETTFNVSTFYTRGGATLYGFFLFHEHERIPVAGDLGRLAAMVADGRLIPHIEVEAPWTEIGSVAQQLTERRYTGKAVLYLDA